MDPASRRIEIFLKGQLGCMEEALPVYVWTYCLTTHGCNDRWCNRRVVQSYPGADVRTSDEMYPGQIVGGVNNQVSICCPLQAIVCNYWNFAKSCKQWKQNWEFASLALARHVFLLLFFSPQRFSVCLSASVFLVCYVSFCFCFLSPLRFSVCLSAFVFLAPYVFLSAFLLLFS